MKRFISILWVGTILCLAGFSQEMKNGIASGGFWCMKEGIASGFGEWNFPIHDGTDDFILRDCINIGGFGGTQEKFGGAIIGNKILCGQKCNAGTLVIRTYGLAGVGFGLFGTENHLTFASPYLLSVIFGGGTEIQYSKNLAFVIEFGGSQDFIIGEGRKDFLNLESACPILMLGYRSYF